MTLEIKADLIKPKVLAVGASPRKGGNSDVLLSHFCAGVNQAGLETEEVQLRDCQITPCIGCELCRKTGECSRFDDDMVGIYQKIVESRGLFLISPVHNYNVTAWMKGFIDRLYCFYDFAEPRPGHWSSKLANQGRKAVVAAVAEQRTKEDMGFTLEAMQMPLEALGYEVSRKFPVLGIFEKGKVAGCPEIIRTAEVYGEKLAKEIMQ
ncbi:MAG: flavodoxin family protein [Desulfuromonas sp.]|uniref:flavodoxin family protein n=1 Tax=Desulfuromonas sp. TaxID=892 RepID=UPI000CB5BD4A|nr:flavodoxin family protein [Desulfuromonas sp.]PLX83322.1 MAG: flavodoxin family protein [Desulfuromonas sp.]